MSSSEETRTLSEEAEDENDQQPVGFLDVQPRKCHFVDPSLFFMCLAQGIYEALLPNAIEVQYCRSVLDIDDPDQCLKPTNPKANEIQKFAANFIMYRSFVELLIPAILSFFLGPWSDTFGRKPLMVASSLGYVLTISLWTWGSLNETLHPWVFILFSVPIAFSGGPIILFLSSFCYVCDVSTIENRGTRLGFLQACLYFGTLAGTILAPHLVTQSYTAGFAIALFCVCIALTYLYFMLSESVTVTDYQRNAVSRNPFKLDQLRSLYETCYVKQSSKTFLILLLLILLMSLSLIQVLGEGVVFYFFLQHILGWTLTDYTPLNCFSIIVYALGAWAGTWLLTKYLKLHELYALTIASFFRVVAALSLMFGTKIWHIYLTRILGSLTGLYGPVVKVFLSKIIAPEDVGKVFCLLGSLESFTPLLGSVVYTALYNATIDSYPRAVFFLSGILCAYMMLVIAFIVKIYVRPSSELLVPSTSSINI